MIPRNIVQEQLIYFSYKPIDTHYKQLLKQEAKEGNSVFAHILNDKPLPGLKMVTSLEMHDCSESSSTKDGKALLTDILSYIGLV